ncbi:thrombospondin-type laminin G domain and EAR repeat-containing protein [Pholidichthys leucotaenia]
MLAYLLLTSVLLTVSVHSYGWRPCTDLLPLDLLSRALPCPGQALSTKVQMVQSKGSRGFRLVGTMAAALSFSASQIFTNCGYFPAEFSLVTTVKMARLKQKTQQYLLSVVQEGSGLLLLGLQVSENHLHLLIMPPGLGVRSRLSFKDVGLDDSQWHTLVLAVSGPYATLTVDCGLPVELKQAQSFPSSLNTRGSRFYIGNRGHWRGRYTGLLRQLVLLPGSDASSRLCPNQDPSLAELSVPDVLKSIPLRPETHRPVYPYRSSVVLSSNPMFPPFMVPESRIAIGPPAAPPRCSESEGGQLWFSPEVRGLFICDGHSWRTLLQAQQRLDYVEDYQDLYTRSETFDLEVFSVPGEGLFMAAANRDSDPGSGIYRWTNGSFQLHQNISTREARAWKHFTVGNKIFLAVANFKEAEPELSVIYRWSRRRRRFVRFQTLQTHAAVDWEAFSIHNESFLVVANHRRARDSNHNIHSVVYRWNPNTQLFEVNQTLPTSGAYDWEFFTVGPYHFLAVANTFDGRTTIVNSAIYVWVGGRFQLFQSIPTVGATDWETFQIDGRFFLAVANSQRISERGPSLYSINSTVYELNTLTQTFIRFQDVLTYSAVDWEFFTVGDEKFLVVANSYDGSSYSLNSIIYKWRGYEGFVQVHSIPTFGGRDWEHFSFDGRSFLVYSSATSPLSKVFRLKTY